MQNSLWKEIRGRNQNTTACSEDIIFVCFLQNEIVNMFAKRSKIKYYFYMYPYQ